MATIQTPGTTPGKLGVYLSPVHAAERVETAAVVDGQPVPRGQVLAAAQPSNQASVDMTGMLLGGAALVAIYFILRQK